MLIPLRVLIIEDNLNDAEFLVRILCTSGYDPEYTRVEDESALRAALAGRQWDIVTSDHFMPGFSAPRALAVVQELQPDLPVIIVSGEIDINRAVALMKLGACDFVQKRDLVSLPQAVARALREAEIIRENNTLTRDLQKSEAQYRTLVNNSTDPIFTFDWDGNYLFVNDAYASAFGHRTDDIIGRNMREIFDPEDNNRRLQAVRGVMGSGQPRQIEVAVPHQDGSIHIYLTQINPVFTTDGSVSFVSCMSRDITQRKQAEEERESLRHLLNNIIDSMPSILVATDINGQITQWNAQAARETGVSKEQALGRPIDEVLPHFASQMDLLQRALNENLVQHVNRVDWEIEGAVRHFEFMIYPLIASKVEGAVIRVDDITEKIVLQDMIIQTEKMLSVGGLAAGMAHELNNPLSGILQTAQNIERRLSPDLEPNRIAAARCGTTMETIGSYMELRQIGELLQGIHSGGTRATSIIKNMLQFSRRRESQKSAIDLAALLERSLELAANEYDPNSGYDFRHIEIIREYASDMDVVYAYPTEIEQVILNLLNNAAHAMAEEPADHKTPRIILRTLKSDGMAVIEVEDNGPAMDEALQKKIFEPFFTTKPPGAGTGLGLSVSYYIITQNHQGQMLVESQPGEGARVIIRLPFGQAN